ncbi:MAG: hypothetical protein GF308_15930 [Candidatus Heimdallarchaeota archaeon]|nr:hypothetical protein [Candidatus Heimdallarchaeota archaeon]
MEIRVSKLNAEPFGKTDIFLWEQASAQQTIQYLKEAYDFFSKQSVKESYKVFALKVIAKYLTKAGFPRDQKALNAATLYVVNRMPASYPNHLSKREFAERLDVSESSLDWYTNSIVEQLGFFILRDRKNFPYYIERDGTTFAVISSVVKVFVEEAIVQGLADIRPFDIRSVVDQILDMLITKLHIIPPVFRRDLSMKIENDLQEELSQAMI